MRKVFLLLFLIVSLSAKTQYVVNYAQNVDQNELDGIYYNLPRNVIRLDFEVERTYEMKGRYANYAEELLGVKEYVKDNNVKYSLKSVDVNVLTEADDDMVFFVSTDDKVKENLNFNVVFTSEGYMKSFGLNRNEFDLRDAGVVFSGDVEVYDMPEEFCYISLQDEEDDDDEDGESVSTKNKLSEKEVAQTVVDEIKKVRVAYFDLISGYQEVNYGKTMNIMLDELKKMEEEYLGLFLGKTIKHVFTKTFYVVPEEGNDSYVVAKFSETDGFNAKNGSNVKVLLQDISSSNVKKITKDTVKNTTYNNRLVYREPAYVNMKLMLGDSLVLYDRLQINQLGTYVLLPMNKMKFEFDVDSGRLISAVKE